MLQPAPAIYVFHTCRKGTAQVREIFTRLLRNPPPRPAQIAAEINRALQRKEDVSGRSKPATDGRLKSSHFEENTVRQLHSTVSPAFWETRNASSLTSVSIWGTFAWQQHKST
jgi:hypothetical protein